MRALAVPSGSGGVQARVGPATLFGYSVRESAGTPAVATVILRDGTSAADPARAFVELAADASRAESLPAVEFAAGIFVDRVAGSSELVLYLA